MRVWRIHTKNDVAKGLTRDDLLSFCKKEKIIGVGWCNIRTRMDSEDAIKQDAQCYSNAAAGIKAVNSMRKMQIGDLIWTRQNGIYYLCKVTGLWKDSCPSDIHDRLDISNYVSAEWLEIGMEDLIPGKVVSSFRPAASAQSISGVEEITKVIWNKYRRRDDYSVQKSKLDKITNIPATIVSIGFKPVDNATLINAISRSVVQQRGMAEGAKDPLSRQRAEKAADDGEKIIMQIDREGETVGLMSVSVMPIAKDEKTFKKVCRRAESIVSVLKCKMRTIPNLQKESFQHISPSFPTNSKIESILQKIVPLSTFVGGFPFASSGFNDGEGYYFAQDSSGGLVIVDVWKRGGDCTNSNFVIMGNSGVGKSTAIKHILMSEYMKGTKIIVADPESEYKDLCFNLGGDWINAVGGSTGMINPLQVRPSPRDDEQEKDSERLYRDEGYGMNDLALHMKNLEIFFNLYIPSITDMQRAVLKKCLVELYKQFGITWDTDVSKLTAKDFPIFSDLYQLVEEKAATEQDRQVYADLALLLNDLANGSDSFIWNGHSTITSDSQFIVLDTNALQETSDSIKRTQYFNILTYCWEQMSRNREERVLLICDEAYLMIDQKVPQSLVYLRNVMKRARKYEGALGIISHSVIDFLSEGIKQYGQALIDIPCYKLLMGTDGPNLKETAKLYDLTEAEQELLLARKRGHALFMVGAKRLHINFEIPDYKMMYMGKAGGR